MNKMQEQQNEFIDKLYDYYKTDSVIKYLDRAILRKAQNRDYRRGTEEVFNSVVKIMEKKARLLERYNIVSKVL